MGGLSGFGDFFDGGNLGDGFDNFACFFGDEAKEVGGGDEPHDVDQRKKGAKIHEDVHVDHVAEGEDDEAEAGHGEHADLR